MSTPWHDLLANLAILALFISVWSNIQLLRVRSKIIRQLGFGLLLGVGAITVMMLPFQIEKGVFIDLRTTLVAVAGFFGGPVPMVVTTLLAGAFRIYAGGAGAVAGLMGIAIAATVGIMAYLLRRQYRPSIPGIIVFSATVALSGLLSFLALPSETLATVLSTVLLPVTIVVFAATLMVSLAIENEMRRREAILKNHIYKEVIDSLPDCLNVKDTAGRFIIANPATANLMKAERADSLIGKTDLDFYPPEIAQRFKQDEDKVLGGGEASVIEQHLTHRDGSDAWLSTLKAPLFDETGRVTGLITHNRDVTAKKQLEEALAQSERKFAAALKNMADGLVMFDNELNLVFCNEQYRMMFPRTADLRVPGTPAASILYASIARGELVGMASENVTEWVNAAVMKLRHAGTVQFPLFDGRWIESRTRPAADGTCFVVCSDVTKAKQSERAMSDLNLRLAELAETDGLTGLLNRRAFDAVLKEEIERVGSGGGALSLLMLDVDRFKAFNDTYGHTTGDDCLQSIAHCLRISAGRPADRVARYGGEEMVLILPNTSEESAVAIAHKVRNRIRELNIVHTGSEKGIVTASIGVATLPNHTIGPDAGRLVMRADEALYTAKAAGRDIVRTWQPAKPTLVAAK